MKYNPNSWHFKLFGVLLVLALIGLAIKTILNL
jgi:hypothetical protein